MHQIIGLYPQKPCSDDSNHQLKTTDDSRIRTGPLRRPWIKNNRWVKLSECIPWDELAESYYQGLPADRGRPLKDAQLVIGAVIINTSFAFPTWKPCYRSRKTRTCNTSSACRVIRQRHRLPRRYWSKSANAWARSCSKASIAPLSRRMRAKSRSSLNASTD